MQGQLLLTQFEIGVEQGTMDVNMGNGPEKLDAVLIVAKIPVAAAIVIPLTHAAAHDVAVGLAEKLTVEERKALVAAIVGIDSKLVLATPASAQSMLRQAGQGGSLR